MGPVRISLAFRMDGEDRAVTAAKAELPMLPRSSTSAPSHILRPSVNIRPQSIVPPLPNMSAKRGSLDFIYQPTSANPIPSASDLYPTTPFLEKCQQIDLDGQERALQVKKAIIEKRKRLAEEEERLILEEELLRRKETQQWQ